MSPPESPLTVATPAAGALRDGLDSSLRGSGQVIFMAHRGTGAVNLLALAWGAWAGGTTWSVVLGAVVGLGVATALAAAMRLPEQARRAGLYGFNGLLVGAAIPTFLAPTPRVWVLLVLACAGATVVARALERALAPWQLPGLTFPFVLVTWLVLLAAYPLAGLTITGLPPATLPLPAVELGALPDAAGWLRATLVSVAQVFFVDDPVSGALFLLALALASPCAALLAAAGAALAVASALLLGADRDLVAHGLWGYSAALTAPAVGCVFRAPGARTWAACVAATLLTVLVQGASFTLAGAVGVAPLTFPFVLATWVFLLARGRGAAV